MVGESLTKHLMHADDLVAMSPYSAGLHQLLKVCFSCGVQYAIKFNSKKSVITIPKTKEDQKDKRIRSKSFPHSFCLTALEMWLRWFGIWVTSSLMICGLMMMSSASDVNFLHRSIRHANFIDRGRC